MSTYIGQHCLRLGFVLLLVQIDQVAMNLCNTRNRIPIPNSTELPMLPAHDPSSVLGDILERNQADAWAAVFVDPLALKALVGPCLDHREPGRHLEVLHRGELQNGMNKVRLPMHKCSSLPDCSLAIVWENGHNFPEEERPIPLISTVCVYTVRIFWKGGKGDANLCNRIQAPGQDHHAFNRFASVARTLFKQGAHL